jgi:RHS repeat-associated protein
MDCDGDVDFADINPFILAISDPNAYQAQFPTCNLLNGDLDGDGDVDFDDIDYFGGLFGATGVRAVYTWDGENRLVRVAPASPPADGSVMVEFAYDYLGRRVQKKVSTRQSGAWTLTLHRQYVWGGTGGSSASGGWLLLMELDGLGGTGVPPVRKYTWGLDLAGLNGSSPSPSRGEGRGEGAGLLQAAGGIGGLLAMSDPNDPNDPADTWGDFVYTYDGNGNVGQLIDWSHDPNDPNGAIVARYEYDPYGDLTASAGPYAALNPWRFSTKQLDSETGQYYFGRRPYEPDMGRWGSRDPIAEDGGLNLYGFVLNRPTERVDALGLAVAQSGMSDGRHKVACCRWGLGYHATENESSCGPRTATATDCCRCGDGPNYERAPAGQVSGSLRSAVWGECCRCRVEVRRRNFGVMGQIWTWPNHIGIFVKCSDGSRWNYGHPEGYGDASKQLASDATWISQQYPVVVNDYCVACDTANKMQQRAKFLVGAGYGLIQDCYWGVREVIGAGLDVDPTYGDDCPTIDAPRADWKGDVK